MGKKYDVQELIGQAKADDTYWTELALLEFSEDVIARMEHLGMSRSELAQRIDSSPAYVTKILRGSSNFTLQSMVKISRAVGCELRTHLQPAGMESHWFDLLDARKPAQTGFKTSHELHSVMKQYTRAADSADGVTADDTLALAS